MIGTNRLLLSSCKRLVVTCSSNDVTKVAIGKIKYFSSDNVNEAGKTSSNAALLVKSPFPDIVFPKMTLDEFVWRKMDRWSDHTALVCGVTGRKYSYKQLRTLCRRFAASLQKQGFKAGDVLCMMLPNQPEFAIVLLGAVEAGLTVSTMNSMYTSYEMAHQLEDCGAVCFVCDRSVLPKLKSTVETIQSKRQKPFSLFTITVNSIGTDNYDAVSTVDFNDMIGDHVDASNVEMRVKPTDIVVMPYSSGTTGLSKGVELTHSNVIANSIQISRESLTSTEETTVDHQDVVPGILPFYHIYGLTVALVTSLCRGNKIVTLPKFDQQTFPSILKDHKVTTLYAVPPIVLYLGNYEAITGDHLASVNHIISGAGPLGADDIHKVLVKSKNNALKIRQGFGMTETSAVVTLCPTYIEDYATAGTPVPNTVMKVIKEDGSLCSAGEHGEICARGPQIMKAYHNLPDETSKTIDKDNFIHTGDVGYYDTEGKFFIVERIKELIKVKGFQVPPAELEAILRTFPGVMEAAVIGIADEKTGEKPLAFVVRNSTAENVTEDALKKHVEDKVAPFKKLSAVIFVDSIPKNPSGKILRRLLRQEYNNKI